jgi:hypothetical protein
MKYKQSTSEYKKENPERVRYFTPVQTGPGLHPAYYSMGTS